MNTAECHSRARACLSGRYGEAFIVTAVCIFVFVTFRAAIMLSVNAIGDETFSWFAEGILTALCFIIITPLLTGGVWWFYQTVSGGDNRSLLKLYSGFRLNRRAALLYIFMWLKGFISLFPTAVCWTTAYILIHGEYDISAEIAVFAKTVPKYAEFAAISVLSAPCLRNGIRRRSCAPARSWMCSWLRTCSI